MLGMTCRYMNRVVFGTTYTHKKKIVLKDIDMFISFVNVKIDELTDEGVKYLTNCVRLIV